MSTNANTFSSPKAPVNHYLKTRVMTASPVELRLLLLDGAIKFANQGRQGLVDKDFEAVFEGISQCRDIVTELLTTIGPDVEPSLAAKVKGVLTWLFTELTSASMEKSIKRMDGVISILEYERETWSLLIEKLKAEQGVNAAPTTGTNSVTGESSGLSVAG